MTEGQADRRRAIMSPIFVALMVWNAATAHSARNRWIALVAALLFAGCAGWFGRKVWEAKQPGTDRRDHSRPAEAKPRDSADSFAG